MTERHDQEAALVERAQRDPEFRARLLADARAAIAEALGIELPADLTIRVIEEQPGEAVLVLPAPPASSEVTDEALAEVAGGSGGSWCGASHCSAACNCPSLGCMSVGCP